MFHCFNCSSLSLTPLGNTPLHECVKRNMLDCAKKLLDRGSDVNHLNQAGYSPLHLALMAGENFDISVVEALVTRGYNTDVNLPDKCRKFYTRLYILEFIHITRLEAQSSKTLVVENLEIPFYTPV